MCIDVSIDIYIYIHIYIYIYTCICTYGFLDILLDWRASAPPPAVALAKLYVARIFELGVEAECFPGIGDKESCTKVAANQGPLRGPSLALNTGARSDFMS